MIHLALDQMIAPAPTRRVVLQTEELEEARIPFQHHRFGVDTYWRDGGSNDALLKTQEYIRNYRTALHKGVGIVFTGKPRTFKTFLACYALRLLIAEDKDCLYLTHRELTDASMGKKGVLDREISRIIKETTFLVIDQISNDPNDGEKKVFMEAVKTRRTEGLPTFFITELSMKLTSAVGFKNVYGSAELYKDLADYNWVIECSMDNQKSIKATQERLTL